MIQVLIVGAGPVGLTLASELHRHGVEFRILDKAAAPHGNSQAAVLWPRTQEVLDLMGLRAHWDPISIPWRGMSLLGVDRHLADAPFEGVEGPHPLPILVGQDQTEKVFNAHLAEIGHPVERQREVIEVTPAADGAEVRVRHADGAEETIRADWVVGCDGSGSVVRTAMGVEFKREFVRGFRFIQGDFRIKTSLPLEAGWGYATLGPGNASCFLIQVAVDGHFRIAIGGDDVDENDKGPPTLDQIQEQLRSFVAFDAELSDPTWLNLYRTSYSAATSFRAGRLLVAGDAAHVWIPVSGQGMNTGIQDAFNLAWKLAAVIQGRSEDGLLDSYGVERRPVAEAEITSTVTQYRAMANADPMFRGVVQQFLAIAGNQPELIDRYMRQASEIEIAYVASPLSHSAGVTGLPAGSRAPDAYVGDPAQAATVRLFDLYRSDALTLLALCGAAPSKETIAAVGALAKEIADAFGDQVQVRALITDRKPAEAPAELRQLLDARGTAHRRFSATVPSIHLVRPDGYTAFRGALGDADALIAHLDRLIRPKPRSGSLMS